MGITFYEFLTRELPFICNDAIELIHCHIAKTAPSILQSGRKDFPETIDKIIQKLMAKNAEDRYQSALGLKHDLETCLCQIKTTGKIDNFEIGKHDIYDKYKNFNKRNYK